MMLEPEVRLSPPSDADTLPLAEAPVTSLRVHDLSGARAIDPSRARLAPETAELFRGLYTRAGVRNKAVLAVCSAIAGEGKTTIGLGLAFTFAQDFPDRRVLLVEADTERPVLASRFGLMPNPGLVDCLLQDEPIQVAYRSTSLENLHLLPSGGPTDFPGRVLRSTRMASVVEAMCQTHDLVVLDIPGLLVNTDAALLAELAEGVIFVVRAGVTPMPRVKRALAQLDPKALRGVVLNGATTAIPAWVRRLCGL